MPWGLLGIILAVCAVLCAVGFYKFVYFLSILFTFYYLKFSLDGTSLSKLCSIGLAEFLYFLLNIAV